jgi:glycosyltransferase involved in cell wall biosynthesis
VKLILVSGSLPAVRCGIGDYTARLASQLATVPGQSVQILTTKNALVSPEAAVPAQVIQVENWGLPSVIRSAWMIRRLRPDVVHVEYPAVGYARSLGVLFLPLAVRVLARVPVVVTIHEWSEKRWHGRLATEFMALTSSRVVVPDPLEAEGLRQRLRPFGTRVDVAEMISTVPVNPKADRAAFRARLRVAPGEFLVGSFGLIHPRRRVEDLIDGLAALRRSTPAKLLIVGGEAEYDAQRAREYAAALKKKIDDLGLSTSVTWLGYVGPADVSTALQASDVAALLYREGASQRNTTLEAALEHRLPVVTTDGPATSDSLRATPNIYFVKAGAYTPDDLAQAILSAARTGWVDTGQPAAGSRLGDQVAWHLSLYRELVGRRSRTPIGAPPS